LIVRDDHVLSGTHSGTVHVEAGQFTLTGVLVGTLDLQGGVRAQIGGRQLGTVNIASGAEAVVRGQVRGTVNVETGGSVRIEADGLLAGSLTNNGLVVIRGTYGGTYSGSGHIQVEPDARIVRPVMRNGISY